MMDLLGLVEELRQQFEEALLGGLWMGFAPGNSRRTKTMCHLRLQTLILHQILHENIAKSEVIPTSRHQDVFTKLSSLPLDGADSSHITQL